MQLESNKMILVNNYLTENTLQEIRNYIGGRYQKFLDYSKFHCEAAGFPEEAYDILNEVMLSVLLKNPESLNDLYNKKKTQYRELDFFILRMIKLNVYSPTSPYQNKFRNQPEFLSINIHNTEIEDEPDNSIDTAALQLKQFRLIRYVFESLNLSENERLVFQFRFFEAGKPLEWKHVYDESYYKHFKIIQRTIHQILYIQGLTRIKPDNKKMNNRIQVLVSEFFKNRKITISKN